MTSTKIDRFGRVYVARTIQRHALGDARKNCGGHWFFRPEKDQYVFATSAPSKRALIAQIDNMVAEREHNKAVLAR